MIPTRSVVLPGYALSILPGKRCASNIIKIRKNSTVILVVIIAPTSLATDAIKSVAVPPEPIPRL